MADSIKQFSFRMTEDTLYALKKAALERRTTATELAKKVLSDWWASQPEGKSGPLFPEETSATTSEQSTPKTAPKAAAAKKAATKKPAAKTKAKAR